MVTITRETATELTEMIEDAVEYICREASQRGELISGETAWKIVTAYAMAKEAVFNGEISDAWDNAD